MKWRYFPLFAKIASGLLTRCKRDNSKKKTENKNAKITVRGKGTRNGAGVYVTRSDEIQRTEEPGEL
jgi:hypothetical protein